MLATVVSPEAGIYASGDGGASWTFAPGSFDFREVVFAKGATNGKHPGKVLRRIRSD